MPEGTPTTKVVELKNFNFIAKLFSFQVYYKIKSKT